MKPVFFASSCEFRRWLEGNHASEPELWVGFWKAHTGKGGLTYEQAVDDSLCFGWITCSASPLAGRRASGARSISAQLVSDAARGARVASVAGPSKINSAS